MQYTKPLKSERRKAILVDLIIVLAIVILLAVLVMPIFRQDPSAETRDTLPTQISAGSKKYGAPH